MSYELSLRTLMKLLQKSRRKHEKADEALLESLKHRDRPCYHPSKNNTAP